MNPSQKKVAAIFLRAGMDSYVSESGREFRINPVEFSKFLRSEGISSGVSIGQYIRGERRVPAGWEKSLQGFGAVFKRPARDPFAEPRERGLNMQNAFDMFVEAVRNHFKGGVSVSDIYVNVPKEESYDDIIGILLSSSYDIAENFVRYPEGPAKKWMDKMKSAIDSGNYQRGEGPGSQIVLRNLALDAVADIWFEEASSELKSIMRNPAEKARLDSMRPSSSW